MRDKLPLTFLLSALLAVASIALLALIWVQVSALDRGVQRTLAHVNTARTVVESVWESGSIQITYTTTQGETHVSETLQGHAARHRRGVSAMLLVFPKQE